MISVVVVSFNTKELLRTCLGSLGRYLPSEAEVIVVDNASEDGSAKMVRERFPEIQLVRLEKNIGFGSANNVGMRLAKGDIFWLLNSDTEVLSSPKPVLKFMKDFDASLVGVRLVNSWGEVQKYICGGFHNLLSPIMKFWPFRLAPWNEECPLEVDWVSAASLFLKRKVFEETQGFDEEYFMYFEDQDLCFRAKKVGFRVYYYPDYEVRHLEGKSFKDDKRAMKSVYYQSLRRFFRKTRPGWEGLVLKIALRGR